ncbi:DVU3141 family protein [Dankookia sp. GCM10030260]|uniref:DVU3141 family protein n=1 Tax=Dankookia sp. GCM10030260 TaxID=3273390 RepID=UPI0036164887
MATSTRLALLGALFFLAGCSVGGPSSTLAASPPSVAAVQQDPLGAFIAGAAPGQSGTVVLADGRSTQARVVRAYAAASGRECREVILGAGYGGQASLLCQADGQWVAARPLLLGSGAARP